MNLLEEEVLTDPFDRPVAVLELQMESHATFLADNFLALNRREPKLTS